jgi:hypothetical protein
MNKKRPIPEVMDEKKNTYARGCVELKQTYTRGCG